MNITDLIVEFLEQGNTVEMAGLGTLVGHKENAAPGPDNQTYSANRTQVSFDTQTTGNHDIIRYIARKECVDEKIAESMWKNYMDALNDKLDRTGSHQFTGIGVLQKSNGSVLFIAEPTVADNGGLGNTIGEVRHYDDNGTDPFADYDREEPESIEPAEPKEKAFIPAADETPLSTADTETDETAIPSPAVEPEGEVAGEPSETTADIQSEPVFDTEVAATPVAAAPTAVDIFADMADNNEDKKKKKKKHKGRWLLWLLLLLCIAYGSYYCYTHYYPQWRAQLDARSAENHTAPAETHANQDRIFIFTYNTDLLEYDGSEKQRLQERIVYDMHDYVMQFLSSRHYTNAKPYMEAAMADYAGQRIEMLMDNSGYSPTRFFETEDYVRETIYNSLKTMKSTQTKARIQSELMEMEWIETTLSNIVDTYGLNPTDVGLAAARPATPVVKTSTPVHNATILKRSKKGFDIVSGFSTTDLNLAKREAARLKGLGCDAYIIDLNKLYYISMGSASTRTEAEALLRQVTSWYQGSVAIKEFER